MFRVISSSSFFFFKQKTAYEIGLGIPAEPLFRSFLPVWFAFSREGSRNRRRLKANQTGKKFRVGIKSNISTNRNNLIRSEERRVGKECRSRWRPSHAKIRKQTDRHKQRHPSGMRN